MYTKIIVVETDKAFWILSVLNIGPKPKVLKLLYPHWVL